MVVLEKIEYCLGKTACMSRHITRWAFHNFFRTIFTNFFFVFAHMLMLLNTLDSLLQLLHALFSWTLWLGVTKHSLQHTVLFHSA